MPVSDMATPSTRSVWDANFLKIMRMKANGQTPAQPGLVYFSQVREPLGIPFCIWVKPSSRASSAIPRSDALERSPIRFFKAVLSELLSLAWQTPTLQYGSISLKK